MSTAGRADDGSTRATEAGHIYCGDGNDTVLVDAPRRTRIRLREIITPAAASRRAERTETRLKELLGLM